MSPKRRARGKACWAESALDWGAIRLRILPSGKFSPFILEIPRPEHHPYRPKLFIALALRTAASTDKVGAPFARTTVSPDLGKPPKRSETTWSRKPPSRKPRRLLPLRRYVASNIRSLRPVFFSGSRGCLCGQHSGWDKKQTPGGHTWQRKL